MRGSGETKGDTLQYANLKLKDKILPRGSMHRRRYATIATALCTTLSSHLWRRTAHYYTAPCIHQPRCNTTMEVGGGGRGGRDKMTAVRKQSDDIFHPPNQTKVYFYSNHTLFHIFSEVCFFSRVFYYLTFPHIRPSLS